MLYFVYILRSSSNDLYIGQTNDLNRRSLEQFRITTKTAKFVKDSGSFKYEVYVSTKNYDEGTCTCYLGQNNTLCKHMVAVAIFAVLRGRKLTMEEKEIIRKPRCSNRLETLSCT